MLSWQYALIIAGCLGLVAVASRVARVARTWTGWSLWGGVAWEAALLFALYGLWMFAGSFTVMSPDGALPRARWLWHAERLMYLPSETGVQRLFLPHPLLIQAFNLYYDILHFPLLGVCLVWLYVRHRDRYPSVRTTVALFTGATGMNWMSRLAPVNRATVVRIDGYRSRCRTNSQTRQTPSTGKCRMS